MKKTLLMTFSLLALALGILFFSAPTPTQRFVEGELLYKVSSYEEAVKLSQDHDLSLHSISAMNIATFSYDAHHDVDYLETLGFAKNGLNAIVRPPWERPTSTDDPYLKDQYAITLMQTNLAWDVELGSEDVVVAIIDTGIDTAHPEFSGRILSTSYNAYTQTAGLSAVVDDHGHGTMVAGVIGANKDNSVGIAGIAQNVKLLVIKANVPTEGKFQDSALIDGIYYAIQQGVDIINMSLGGTYANPQTKIALDAALAAGIVVVAAAGNDGTNDLFYPAAFETTLSISAIDASKKIASFSNFGPTIDLTAPGVSIVTTSRNNGYVTTSGTSFASPQVAGVLALMKSYLPDLTREEMISRLIDSAEDLGVTGKDVYYGHGMVNTYKALTLAFTDVTFDTFGLIDVAPVSAVIGQPLTNIPTPHVSGYTFMGWYKDAALTALFTSTDLVTASMVLYGRFESQYITVSFMDGSITLATDILYKGTAASLFTPTKLDHRFLYWSYDLQGLTPYLDEPLSEDTTLYAQFEPIEYKTLTLLNEGTAYSTTTKEINTLMSLPTLQKTGYIFMGWLDETTLTYYTDSLVLDSDYTLISAFEPLYLSVVLMLDGEIHTEALIAYGDTFSPTLGDFLGWFTHPTEQILYNPQALTESLTLYAVTDPARVSLTLNTGEGLIDYHVKPGVTFELYDYFLIGKQFMGWSTSNTLYVIFTDTYLLEDATLYAIYEEDVYLVRFFDYTNTFLIQETNVRYGESVTPPSYGEIPDDEHFSYTFFRLSSNTSFVTSSVDVFPIYSRTFKQTSAYLLPGVDTLSANNAWIDQGIYLNDASLSVVVESNVNTSQRGRYMVKYHIEGAEGRFYTLTRVVRVTEEENTLSFTLNKGRSTLTLNESYVESGATYSIGTLTITGSVDPTTPGVYVITYTLTHEGKEISKSRYVFVLASETNSTVAYISRKEGEDHA